MQDDRFAQIVAHIRGLNGLAPVGRVRRVGGATVTLGQVATRARLGDRIVIQGRDERWTGEVINIAGDEVEVLTEADMSGISTGLPAMALTPPRFAPSDAWIGRVVDPDGNALDGRPLLPSGSARRLTASPPPPQARRGMGARVATGLAVMDTLLPLVKGQRVGLFSGSGVGKSTLLGLLARSVEADVIVIGLVGERGRELREFVDTVLGQEGLARSVVVAATSDRAPQTRRRCAWAAMAVAEHFRDEGKHVLLLMDSVTRFAEAHREICVAAGDSASLRGFPASTTGAIAALCERAGPGSDAMGDITAVFTVLVAGSDMEEPIADIVRGVLDGHIVLDRKIAERGRFPAIDILRSVSRSLPDAASADENTLIQCARASLGTYDQAELMVQSGLYAGGSDPEIDRAIQLFPKLDRFAALHSPDGVPASFAALRAALA